MSLRSLTLAMLCNGHIHRAKGFCLHNFLIKPVPKDCLLRDKGCLLRDDEVFWRDEVPFSGMFSPQGSKI